MMPFFFANFGSTLDELGEPDEDATMLDSVSEFCIYFGGIGAIAGIAGFVMVSTWTIAGERQVRLTGFLCVALLRSFAGVLSSSSSSSSL